MGHAEDLLAVAERYDLTSTEAEKRRCISTAYYAVFHLIVESIVHRLIPAENAYAQNMARRALAHTTLKDVCSSLAPQGQQSPPVKAPASWRDAQYAEDVDPKLSSIATRIIDMHRWREIADYDLYMRVWQASAESQLERAREVFSVIQAGIPEPQWTLFLASLLFKGRK